MEKLKSIIERIRWRSVLAVLLLIAVVIIIFTQLPTGYEVGAGGNIGLWAAVEPASIVPGDEAVVNVELKNMNTEKGLNVIVTGETYTELLSFEVSRYDKLFQSEKISVGPQEIRRLSVKMRSKQGILDGKYSIDVKAFEEGKEDSGAKQRVFIEIAEKK